MAGTRKPERRKRLITVLSTTIWCYLVWVLLTWTLTLEQQLIGLTIALVTAVALMPLGNVPGIWLLLRPRSLLALLLLFCGSTFRVIQANISLARRILSPSLPLHAGMTIVTTEYAEAAGLGAVGIVTSLVVDNQIVDLDPQRNRLQYHCVNVPSGGQQAKRAAINGATERQLAPLLSEPARPADSAEHSEPKEPS